MVASIQGSSDLLDLHHVRHVDRIVNLDLRAVGQRHLVDDARRGRDQVEIEFALQPLLDDFEMQQAQEAAAEAEAERGRGFHFEREAGVVEAQLAHRRAQFLELRGIDREQAAEHHRDRRLEAGQRLRRRLLRMGDGVADARVGHFLDRGGEEADLARPEFFRLRSFSA